MKKIEIECPGHVPNSNKVAIKIDGEDITSAVHSLTLDMTSGDVNTVKLRLFPEEVKASLFADVTYEKTSMRDWAVRREFVPSHILSFLKHTYAAICRRLNGRTA